MSLTHSEQLLIDALGCCLLKAYTPTRKERRSSGGFNSSSTTGSGSSAGRSGPVLVIRMGVRGANVIDLIPISVRIFLENLDLRSVCSCGQSDRSERCEHVVCALVTLLHLLKPNLFRMTRENPAYRAQLEAGLLKSSSPASYADTGILKPREGLGIPGGRIVRRFQVVLEANEGRLRAYPEANGKRLDEDFDFRAVPWEIAYLARSAYQHDMSYALSVFLKRTDNQYPLFYEEGAQRHEIKWLGERNCPTSGPSSTPAGKRSSSVRPALWTGTGGVGLDGDRQFRAQSARSAMAQIAPRTGWQCWDMVRALYGKVPQVRTASSCVGFRDPYARDITGHSSSP